MAEQVKHTVVRSWSIRVVKIERRFKNKNDTRGILTNIYSSLIIILYIIIKAVTICGLSRNSWVHDITTILSGLIRKSHVTTESVTWKYFKITAPRTKPYLLLYLMTKRWKSEVEIKSFQLKLFYWKKIKTCREIRIVGWPKVVIDFMRLAFDIFIAFYIFSWATNQKLKKSSIGLSTR